MGATRYFQGTSVTGSVSAAPARTFRELVDSLRLCPVLGITRSAFMALGKAERNEKKKVPFYVPACFRSSPSKRVYSEAIHCNLIFLDIDNGRDAAPFVRSPELLHTALAGFSFAAHTTASSTPENPRMRVIVDASSIALADYPKAVATIAAMLGLSTLTRESKVAVQPMFNCVLFSDSTDEDHPLLTFRVDGRPFKREDTIEDAEVASEPRVHQRNGNGSHADALDFLRAPVPEITLAIAKEALESVDPDCGYMEWLEVAAALRHQFSPHQEDEAYELFDEWSSTGSKYAGEDDTKAKWTSIRQTPVGRAPVTIRSLLKQAIAGGWDDKRVKDNGFAKLQDWMETVATATELLENGVHRILAMPLLTNMQEGRALDYLRKQAKQRFGESIPAAAIKRDLDRTKQEIKAQEKPTEKVREPLWAKSVCYILAAQQFYRHRTGEKYQSVAFDAAYARWLLPTPEALREAGIPVSPATLSRPIVTPSVYALNHLKIPTAYEYEYDPSRPTETFFVKRGRRYVNTYSPTYPELDQEKAEESGTRFLQHVANLVAEIPYRQTLIDFLAFIVQHPGRKIRWAPLIQGVEGCGKTYLAEVMSAVLGSEHVKVINGAAIKSGFNEWSFGHQLIALEEVRVAGTNKYEIMNALKPLITNDTISINEKFRSQRNVENITNYVMFSNHHNCLALTPGDRRYFVIKSPLQSKAQVQALGSNYFVQLFSFKENPGALRSFLMDWNISNSFEPDGHAPVTRYVGELVNDSASDVQAAIRRLLFEGDHPLTQYDIVSSNALTNALALEDGLGRVSGQHVSHVLKEEGFVSVGRHLIGTERHYLWSRNGVTDVVQKAIDRVQNDKKNLHMELLF